MADADTPITDRLEAAIRAAKSGKCAFCWAGNTCESCAAKAVVAALRAEQLVVLTPEAADEILAHALADERRKVAAEIGDALEVLDPIEAALAGQDAWQIAAEVARKHREVSRG